MGEYSWEVRNIWFGVEGPEDAGWPVLGIIKRSGRVQQLGHFCHVKISVNGMRVWASGAEDRIFYMHLVRWKDIGGQLPKDMIPALGWSCDGNRYVFLHESQIVVAGSSGTVIPLEKSFWNESWFLSGSLPVTLLQKGVLTMVNHYIGMLSTVLLHKQKYKPREETMKVTLPVGHFHSKSAEFFGMTGALSLWNGPPPPWCQQVVEVKSPHGWAHVGDDEVVSLWTREGGCEQK